VELPIGSALRQELTRTDYDTCDSDVTTYELEIEDRMARIERVISDMQAQLDQLERQQRR
jgi:hypothetical protein